jgi:SAM-dependent methyltransferase
LIDYHNLARAFVEPGKFNPEFMARYYRALFPDLAHLSDSQLNSHYHNHGRDEGRSASPCDLRAAFLSSLSPSMKVLEIGPFTAPSVRGPNVNYFDVLDADGLRTRAKAHNYPIIEPVRIDYVSPTGDLEIVPTGFDAVYSAHCIEHTPDLIGHLKQVSRILRKRGVYLLTIPDRRYTFDYFRTETGAEEILAAHKEGRTLHSRQAVMDFYLLSTHNDPAAHWRGEHGPRPRPDIAERKELAERMLSTSESGYVDIHTWFLTPESFRRVISDVLARAKVELEVEHVYTTPFGRNEFNAVLRKP